MSVVFLTRKECGKDTDDLQHLNFSKEKFLMLIFVNLYKALNINKEIHQEIRIKILLTWVYFYQ